MSLRPSQWKVFAAGANAIAKAVREATGMRTVFHHIALEYVETPFEIAQFLGLTDPEMIGLVFDTGHYVFGSGDCDASVGTRSLQGTYLVCALERLPAGPSETLRGKRLDYFESLRQGIFCELGQGCVDFPGGAALA